MKNLKQYSEKVGLKEEFLEADHNYKTGQLSQNKYQEVIYKVLTNLLRGYSAVEPYYTEFKEAADKEKKTNLSKVEARQLVKRHSGIEFLKERFLQADRDWKSKRSSDFDFQEVTYEVLINLLINHSSIEPYYTEFKEAAAKQPYPNQIDLKMIWKYIKADTFIKEYLPHIKSYKHKIRGKNGRGNPVDFSPEEKIDINAALGKLLK